MGEGEIEFIVDTQLEERHIEMMRALHRIELILCIIAGFVLAFLIHQGWG